MKTHKQTTLVIDRKTDRLFNLLAAKHDLNNRGQVACIAIQFLDAIQNQTNYPENVGSSLNGIFENIVNKVKKGTQHGWADDSEERPQLIDSHECEEIAVHVNLDEEGSN